MGDTEDRQILAISAWFLCGRFGRTHKCPYIKKQEQEKIIPILHTWFKNIEIVSSSIYEASIMLILKSEEETAK